MSYKTINTIGTGYSGASAIYEFLQQTNLFYDPFPNSQFSSDENKKVSNKIIEIVNGEYVRGQIDKGTLGARSKGLIQSIFNDYSYKHATEFIDNIQSIVTEYMKLSSSDVRKKDVNKFAECLYFPKGV